MGKTGTGGQMVTPPDDTTADLHAVIATLQAERDAGLAREAALSVALATRTTELAERNTEYSERIDHQAATIDVLNAMSASPGDAQPVFELIVRHSAVLCNAPAAGLFEYDGELVHVRAHHDIELARGSALLEASRRQFPMPPTRGSINCRAILDRQIIHIRDVQAEPNLLETIRDFGHRSQVSVPLMRGERAIGAISLAAWEPGGFTDSQIELLKTFAEQAVIAISSAETYRELQARTEALAQRNREYGERIEQQSATIDVLKAMSSSPDDTRPVFELIVRRAAELCNCKGAGIFEYDGELMHIGWIHGLEDVAGGRDYMPAFPMQPTRGSIVGRTILDQRVIHIRDIQEDPELMPIARQLGIRSALSIPLLRDGTVVGVFNVNRLEPGGFTDSQIALVQTFAEQAVIAITSAKTYRALQGRTNDLQEALEQQTATAEVLQVINASPGDLAPVFDAMLEKAIRVCDAEAGVLCTYDGECFWPVAHRGVDDFPRDPIRSHPETGAGRLARGENVVHILDSASGAPVDAGDPGRLALLRLGGIRTQIAAALRTERGLVGTFTIWRREVRPFSDKQIALLQNFAAQAVIAIENTRLLNEQREALEQQTATAKVLQVINASPGRLEPVFNAIIDNATRLCRAEFGDLAIYDGDVFRRFTGGDVGAAGQALQPDPGTALSQMLGGASVVHIPDVADTDEYRARIAPRVLLVEKFGARTTLWVGLRREDVLLGVLMIYRREVRPFTDRQIALVQNFAAQAVVAMENARLIDEQREALERQTATAEVLQVINASPGNLAPVFDAMLEKVIRLCEAEFGTLRTWDGERFHHGAAHGDPQLIEWSRRQRPFTPDGDGSLGRIVRGEEVVRITDDQLAAYQTSRGVETSGEPPRWDRLRFGALVAAIGLRSGITLALRKDATLLGTITVYRKNDRPFTDKQIALLQNFAAQAVIAMENARLLTETREALEQQTATAEVLQVINASPGDLAPVFDAVLEKAMRLCGATMGGIYSYDGRWFNPVALRGVTPAFAAFSAEHSVPSGPNSAPTLILKTKRPVQKPDLGEVLPYDKGMVHLGGIRALLDVPLLKEGTVLGFIAIYREEAGAFSDTEIALLENFAAQAVIAMENARLLNEIRQRQAELRTTFDNMGDGVAMFDAEHRLAAWNRNFQRIIALPDILLTKRPSYPDYLRMLTERGEFGPLGIEAELSRHIEDTDRELRLERVRPDGQVIEVRRNAVPGGGFVLIYSDITERKRSEGEIRAARDAAEAALRELRAAQASLIQAEKMASLGQLTAGIAHEIKNPLNFVNNFADLSVDLLEELHDAVTGNMQSEIDQLTATLKGNLAKITEHGRRADSIVKNMLLHSRSGPSEHRLIDLNSLVEEALNLAYHGARAETPGFNITMEKQLDPAAGMVEVFPQEITRVLLNLISNGFYAARKRAGVTQDKSFEPKLRLTTRDLGNQVEIHVRDNGTGVGEQVRGKIFEPFFTTKPAGEGTGLGLSISYDIIVKQHGGQLTLDSRPNDFTEFKIHLRRRLAMSAGSHV
jgi:GAF domain-containing protein